VENLAKIFGIEGGETVDDLSSDKVSVSFGVPVNGKVWLTAEPKGGAAPSAFFMRVKMTP